MEVFKMTKKQDVTAQYLRTIMNETVSVELNCLIDLFERNVPKLLLAAKQGESSLEVIKNIPKESWELNLKTIVLPNGCSATYYFDYANFLEEDEAELMYVKYSW